MTVQSSEILCFDIQRLLNIINPIVGTILAFLQIPDAYAQNGTSSNILLEVKTYFWPISNNFRRFSSNAGVITFPDSFSASSEKEEYEGVAEDAVLNKVNIK